MNTVVGTSARLVRANALPWVVGWVNWVAFHSWPLLTGVVLKLVLDRIGDDGSTLWQALALLAGVELGRWLLLVWAVIQYGGLWVGLETTPRLNLLRSLVGDPGPAAARLPGSPGEAVSRFRDDVRDVVQVTDVWVDISGAVVSSAIALAVLAAVDLRITVFVVLPVVAALAFARWLGPRLKAWRLASREATGSVTGYLGDLFGAVLAVKAAGAEGAASRRFRALNRVRARAALADQVGTQVVQSLGGLTGEVAIGVVLLLAAPALRDGDLGVGDIGLFATYVTVIAQLPWWAGRLSSTHRQAEVAVRRLAELDAEGDAARAVRPVPVDLRHEPAPERAALPATPPFRSLEVRGLTVGSAVRGVDLDLAAGQLVVVTGPVGSGKTTLLRALLGLVTRDAGTIRWDGELVEDPSTVLVPPRVAYVPQVPRLCSEPLADAVLLGLPDAGLAEALTLARLDEDVATMPDGVRTEVGAHGVRLSGGQAQRVAAARAFVRRPALLVVDDLSSALDVATEAALWDGLLADGTRTALVVTHRPHVHERADAVVELREGRRVR